MRRNERFLGPSLFVSAVIIITCDGMRADLGYQSWGRQRYKGEAVGRENGGEVGAKRKTDPRTLNG
jgi:hypothetical protein